MTKSKETTQIPPPEFPSLGVKLSHLQIFIENCGGREALKDLTTTEVCEEFVKPMTYINENSYCEMMRDLNGEEAIGESNVFISHAWKYKFLEVIDLLQQYFNNNNNSNKENKEDEIIIWFDIFSINQHKTLEVPEDYWYVTFQSAIKKFGRTVMILSPWNDPIPLTRAWCLWELYCTVSTKSNFEIAMTKESRK